MLLTFSRIADKPPQLKSFKNKIQQPQTVKEYHLRTFLLERFVSERAALIGWLYDSILLTFFNEL